MDHEGATERFDTSVGTTLARAREEQGLALDEVAARTRIPTRHLQAIERGDYAGLPAATYSAGFVKTYARLLGLDGQHLSSAFRAEMGEAVTPYPQAAPYEPADPRRTPPAGLALLAVLVALVAGLGYLYWRGSAIDANELAARGAAGPAATAGVPATPRPAAPAPAAAPSGGPVAIGATDDVWIKVADGPKTLFMGVLKKGDHYQLPADAAAPTLTTGRPGVTTITVGATAIPPVGDPRRAASGVSLKPAELLARIGTPPPPQPPAGAPTPVAPVADGG